VLGPAGRDGPEQPGTHDGRDERGQVGPVGPRQAAGDEQAADGRAHHDGRVEQDLAQGHGGREQVAADHVRHGSRPGGRVQGPQGGLGCGGPVDVPQGRVPVERAQEEEPGGPRAADLGHQDQPAPVHPVGHGACGDGEDDERDELDQPDQPHGEGRTGEDVDLEGEGDHGDLRPHRGDELAEPQDPEVPGSPERGEVDGQPAEGRAGTAAQPGDAMAFGLFLVDRLGRVRHAGRR